MESALPPKILQGENLSLALVYFLLRTPSWESKVLVEHSGKEKVFRRALRNENGDFTIGDISFFVHQNRISLRGVKLDLSADKAD